MLSNLTAKKYHLKVGVDAFVETQMLFYRAVNITDFLENADFKPTKGFPRVESEVLRSPIVQ